MFLKFFHTGNIANNITFILRVLLSCFLISNLSFPENVRFMYSGSLLVLFTIAPSLPRNEHYTQNTISMNEWINREVLIFLIYLFYFIFFLLSSGSLRHVVL